MTQKKELLWVRNVPQQTRLHGDCKCLRREWVTRMLSRALQHWVWEERSWHLRNLWNSPSGKHFGLTKNLLPVVRHPQCWLICPWALPSAIHFSSEPQNTSCFAAATARRPHFLMFLPSLNLCLKDQRQPSRSRPSWDGQSTAGTLCCGLRRWARFSQLTNRSLPLKDDIAEGKRSSKLPTEMFFYDDGWISLLRSRAAAYRELRSGRLGGDK